MTRYSLDTTGDAESDNPHALVEDPEGPWVLQGDVEGLVAEGMFQGATRGREREAYDAGRLAGYEDGLTERLAGLEEAVGFLFGRGAWYRINVQLATVAALEDRT